MSEAERERCANCGMFLYVLERYPRDCPNKHQICRNCWNDHIPQWFACPACDGLMNEGKGYDR